MPSGWRVKYDHTDKLAAFLRQTDAMADKIAQAVIDEAAPNVPVLTGSARDSLYVASALQDGYGAAVERANADRQSADAAPAVITDPVDVPSKGSGRAVVASVVGHMWDLELGGITRPPRPAVLPALDAIGSKVGAILQKMLDEAIK